jgi:ATP-binding protein involved in chromosome partitioning
MLRDVLWGALDYLVFDMPPGTGDAQLSLSQVIPLGGVVMVTTPQDVALLDVRKAIAMFQRLNVPVAVALKGGGAQVGIVDSDVYGPDVPLMLGSRGQPGMFANKILPVEAHGLKLMSLGLLVNEREAVVWRGPMIHSFIQQMLRDVAWGALDYLVFDMPPGTGDAQLSLSQVIPLSGVVMVTTPQDVALLDVRKAIAMFQRLNVPVLGIVENMSGFVCPHCGERTNVFGTAGGQRLSEEYGVPLLAQLPLDPETRAGGDEGLPITLRRPESAQAVAFRNLAAAVGRRLEELAPLRTLPKIG